MSLALVSMLGCNNDKLVPLQPLNLSSAAQQSVNVNFCTDPAYDQKQYLKTIIILDHSFSNQNNFQMNPDGSGTPLVTNGVIQAGPQYGTDPTGRTRYGDIATPGTLLNFLSTTPPNDPTDPRKFFALVDFNSQVSTYPTNSSGFTSDTVDFFNYVQQDATGSGGHPNDQGSTSYLSALTAAYNIINNDIHAAATCAALTPGSASPGSWCPVPGTQVASSYVIVFMSDGSPIINFSGITVDASGNLTVIGNVVADREATNEILGKVGAITSLTANAKFVSSVNLFTIYYYNPGNVDGTAQSLLANMAKVGNGIGYNALSGTNIDYTRFQPPLKRIKYTIADIFVTNSSGTWWNDGRFHVDTDMDGLPDDVEIAWGSDPKNAITDNNGVSDLVKYFVTGAKVCQNKNAGGRCIDPVINYRSGLCSSLAFKNGKFPSSDPDGLNDCEKILLNNQGGIGLPDSNGDLIPDWLEFKNSVPFQLGTSPAVNTPNQDGTSIYQKIKFSLPLNIPAQQMINVAPAGYNMNLVSTTPNQDCYNLAVTGLPVVAGSNTIRVDVIEKSELLQDNYLYRVGKKVISAGSPTLNFQDWNDPAEKAAGTWSMWP